MNLPPTSILGRAWHHANEDTVARPTYVRPKRSVLEKISFFFCGCYVLSFAMLSLHGQFTLLRLFAGPGKRTLLRTRPRVAFKYLHRYLFIGAKRIDRLAALIHHYQYLSACTKPDFFTRLIHEKPSLWHQEIDRNGFAISLLFPCPADQEGDLALLALMNGRRLQIISFSIVPGSMVGEPDERVLFVGRVQGLATAELLRQATRQCGDITPCALLMAALDGVAKAFGVARIVGVSSKEQLSGGDPGTGERLHFDYDNFWISMNAESTPAGFYRLASPLVHKPLASVASNHRKRTRLKRAFKATVSDTVERCLRQDHLLDN